MKWGSLVFASCLALASFSAVAEGQGRGRRDQSPPPQRKEEGPKQSPPPRRDDSPTPRRDQSPPPRRDDDDRQKPPPRQEPPRQRDQSPPPRQDSPPPRQDNGPRRDQTPPQRNDDSRGDSGPRRDQTPPQRNDDSRGNSGPRRDQNPPRQDNDRGNGGYNGGGSSGSGQSGAIDRNRTNPGGFTLPGRNDGAPPRRDTRSGKVNYGTVHNQAGTTDRSGSAVRIDRVPVNPRSGSLEFMVRRQERVNLHQPWRSGYYYYHNNWRDDYFCYPFYTFTPIYNQCVVSPWYYYPHLPAYIVINRIQIINYSPWNFRGDNYNWRRPAWNNYNSGYNNYSDLDYAIDDLVQAFERGDTRALGRLIPRYGRINIALEGQYSYSVDSNDLYDMLLDAIQDTRTERYEIVDVRTWRGEAQVVAMHRYNDPWGRQTTVYHTFRLEQDRNGYVIRDFGTSSYRNGF